MNKRKSNNNNTLSKLNKKKRKEKKKQKKNQLLHIMLQIIMAIMINKEINNINNPKPTEVEADTGKDSSKTDHNIIIIIEQSNLN